MKTGKRSQGRWRKSGKRGVSPIIATILLVAITVVLAAVLYVLISGLTRGPGNTPLGSAIAVSSAVDGTCRTYCNYTFSIQSASSGLTANGLKFQLQLNGVITAYTSVRLIDVSNCAVGYYTTAGWTAGAPAAPNNVPAACPGGTPGLATQISSGDQVILTTTTNLAAGGYNLVVVGAGAYSGTVSAAIP